MKITPIIGLEVHVELNTKSKMFCSCSAEHFHVDPNTHTCPTCLGLPGALPVPNKTACEWCIKLGLALGCTPNESSFFERKNYFYPDLAKGYQLTQYEKPFVINGKIKIGDQEVRINRAHMEEDTGKSVHIKDNGQELTLIDYNRCGVPLVEIVSEPDITSAQMAKDYLLKMQQIIRYIGISDADIEKGSMRCEPTVNLKIEDNDQVFYTPLVEIKNVASLTGVQTAIDFEIKRQTEAFKQTGEVKSKNNKNTFGWDADKNQTFLQREKEGSSDYRYFPEPDIPHIEFTKAEIEAIRKSIPELPDQKFSRYQKDFGLNDYDANLLVSDINFSQIFEKAIGQNPTPEMAKFTANLFLGAIKTYLNESQESLDINKINPEYFKNLFDSVTKSEISATVAKQVIIESYHIGQDPVVIAKNSGLIQVSDSGEIEKLAKEVIAANSKAVSDYLKNPASIGFLIGKLMQASKGSANPKLAKEILEKLLN
ncbi:MAG: Asp-tRNA(Asn)/Glu-tRNA(Gln) amidotransferase subunit GatB [Candidatus Shapirobacteria bacterium]|nr:Asp-tRNA(Asn)/Glu-tRNA(Gln) amidotransferase subunit GatB [Candidatus Shapirobacteria bacterium]MDD4410774.1 Asp-tRNA(Asn)/Glu-tRNA(Gln) amidotransferase subunit GatB [Candidatus Shapirobacteria bacterium]